MAIQAKFKLNQTTEIDAYINLGTIISTKAKVDTTLLGGPNLEITYGINYYTEKDGLLLKKDKKTVSYKGGNVWEEAYEDLKKGFTEYTNV